MPKTYDEIVEQKLETIVELLQNLVALHLSNAGVRQTEIGKRVRVSTAKVGQILAGVRKEK